MQFNVIHRMHGDEVAEVVVRGIFVSMVNLEPIRKDSVRMPHPDQLANVDACSLATINEVYPWVAMLAPLALVDSLHQLAAGKRVDFSIRDSEYSFLKPI